MNTTASQPDLSAAIQCAAGPEIVPAVLPLLQGGVLLDCMPGCTVESLMVERLGIDPEYAFGRVQTIFLDGHPVDRLEDTVHDGAVIALSAALPGLIGATMRKMGVLSSFRSGISHRNDASITTGGDGVFTLKLFNVVLPELGPEILTRGVFLTAQRFASRLAMLPTAFFQDQPSIILDGREVRLTPDMIALPGIDPAQLLRLTIRP